MKKYLLDQTKAYQILSQIDQHYLEQTRKEYIYPDSSDDEGVLTYDSDSSLDIFNKSRTKVTVSSDKVSMTNYGSYFTEVI